eukprot:472495-Alexandrium_andersonii.AAC.1
MIRPAGSPPGAGPRFDDASTLRGRRAQGVARLRQVARASPEPQHSPGPRARIATRFRGPGEGGAHRGCRSGRRIKSR